MCSNSPESGVAVVEITTRHQLLIHWTVLEESWRKYPIMHRPCCSVQLMKHTGGSSQAEDLEPSQHPRTSVRPPCRRCGQRPREGCHPQRSAESAGVSAHLSSSDLRQRSSACQDKTKISAIHLDLSSGMTLSVRPRQLVLKDEASSAAFMPLRV